MEKWKPKVIFDPDEYIVCNICNKKMYNAADIEMCQRCSNNIICGAFGVGFVLGFIICLVIL